MTQKMLLLHGVCPVSSSLYPPQGGEGCVVAVLSAFCGCVSMPCLTRGGALGVL